jgi:ubiquinone/menaquinone biosynthesis C-methylase UbiE
MSGVPSYDAHQQAFHRAFQPELHRILDRLPLPKTARVLDVPCGSGFYTAQLARRIGEHQSLVAVDANDAYVEATRARVAETRASGEIAVQKGDAYRLDCPDGAFDVVWCAQSLISLDIPEALRELHRVTNDTGYAAILEEDAFHHLMLPWPPALEAALPAALYAASVEKFGSGSRLTPTRRLRPLLRRSGFEAIRMRTITIERVAPLDEATRLFLEEHVRYLREFAAPHLPPEMRQLFEECTDASLPRSLFQQADLELVCLLHVYLAGHRATAFREGTSRRVPV